MIGLNRFVTVSPADDVALSSNPEVLILFYCYYYRGASLKLFILDL